MKLKKVFKKIKKFFAGKKPVDNSPIAKMRGEILRHAVPINLFEHAGKIKPEEKTLKFRRHLPYGYKVCLHQNVKSIHPDEHGNKYQCIDCELVTHSVSAHLWRKVGSPMYPDDLIGQRVP